MKELQTPFSLELVVSKTFDFAVLGDNQPEGLLLATGLARKGYSVTILPSPLFDELPAENYWPMTLPEMIGGRRLDDLLFRVGFFRLEESGLVPSNFQWQIVLPKYRLSFDGSKSQWMAEVEREFPSVSEPLIRILNNLRRTSSRAQKRYVGEILSLQKKFPALKSWIYSEVTSFDDRTVYSKKAKSSWVTNWLHRLMNQGTRTYRVNPKLSQPYCHFLKDHARKWGVHLWEESLDFKPSWSGFQLSSDFRTRYLVLNGGGSVRFLGKKFSHKLPSKIQYWLFLDELECPISHLPEPMEEFCHLDWQDPIDPNLSSARLVYTSRDPLRDQARISIGSWLPFENTKIWEKQIKVGREGLKKLLPFLPDESFKPLPSLFDLTEMKGECVKRGDLSRLIYERPPLPVWNKMVPDSWSLVGNSGKPQKLLRRVFSVTPHFSPCLNRQKSFEECLRILDFFDKKRPKFSVPSSAF